MISGPESHSAVDLVQHSNLKDTNMINRIIHISNMRDLLTWMVGESKITETMASGLYKMLDSNDPESIDLAIGIIRTKFREPNGTDV